MTESPMHNDHDNEQASLHSVGSRRSAKKRWHHLSRRTMALSAFVLFLIASIVALVLLRLLDNRQVGFSVASTTTQYTWKFGPTAIFVVVIALWRQVEYRIKTQAAWKQMARGPSAAKLSALLDYVSPIIPVAFWDSLRNRHWDVTLGIGVFAFLKLAVVFSTGLLTLQQSTLRSQEATAQLARGKPRSEVQDVADQMALTYVGWRQRNMSLPDSTLPQAAFQELSPTGNPFPANSTVEADVKAFYPSLQCEIANSSWYFDPAESTAFTTGDRWVKIWIDFSSGIASGNFALERSGCDPSQTECSAERLVPFFEARRPSDSGGVLGATTDIILVALTSLTSEVKPGNVRANMTDGQFPYQDVLDGTGWQQSVSWVSAVLCRVEYAIETGRLTAKNVDGRGWSNKTLSSPLTNTGDLLFNYTTANLTSDVNYIAQYLGQYIVPRDRNPLRWSDTTFRGDDWFNMMLFETSGDDIAVFQDPKLIIEPATQVFQGIASTWVGSWLDFPQDTTAASSFTYDIDRLRFSNSPFWLMEAFLIAALLCVLILLILHTTARVPVHSGLLLKDAMTLRDNKPLTRILAKLGAASDEELDAKLSGTAFRTQPQDLMIIPSAVVSSSSPPDPTHATTWTPISTQIWFGCLVMALAALSIVGLEVVQRMSDTRDPRLELNISVSIGQDLVAILPAIVMLIISMLFNAADFSFAATSSYLRLARNTVPITNLATDPLQQLPPVALLNEFRFGQWSSSIVMLGALLGSVLTIFSSALYTISGDPQSHSISVQTIDEFDFDTNVVANDTSASQPFTYLQRSNGSYPQGTYEEIAYPMFELDQSDSVVKALIDGGASTSVRVDMTVIRASLNCSLVPQADMVLVANKGAGNGDNSNINYQTYANLTSISTLPEHCQRTAPAYTNSTEYRIDSNRLGTVYEGNTSYNAEFGSPNGVMPDNRGLVTVDEYGWNAQFPPTCPSISFTVGTYELNGTDTSTTTRLICTQRFDAIPSTLTFLVPGMDLDKNTPPVLHEDQAYLASNLALNFTDIFDYPSAAAGYSNSTTHTFIDDFFDAVTHSIDAVPLDELLGEANQQRLIDAVQRVYRLYMTQVVGGDLRTNTRRSLTARQDGTSNNINTTTIGTRFPAQIQDTNKSRVVQHRTPKAILQALLATMMACFVLGWRDLYAIGKVLPHNPCSIAGRMSYLAGSHFVDALGPDLDEKALATSLEGQGARFALGWWRGESVQHALSTAEKKADAKGGTGYVSVQEADASDVDAAAARGRFGVDIVRYGA